MKLSYAVSMQETSFLSVAMGNWEDKMTFISEMGYDGIELAIREPSVVDVDHLKKLLSESNLELAAIGTGQAFVDDKLYLTSEKQEVCKKAMERLEHHINLASEFDCFVVIGLIRGAGDTDNKKIYERLVENLGKTCEYASSMNVDLILEPINRYETSLINTVEQGLKLIDDIKKDSLFLLLDSFHMNIEERDLIESIILSGSKLKHFHVADNNRWYPGNGHVDFERILKTLKNIDYKGFISGEMLSLPDFETSAKMTIKNINKFSGQEI